jgi:hypothetical protein
MKTIVCNGHHELSGVQYRHGDELPPDTLNGELLDFWLDKKIAFELDGSERRSLHRLFPAFSGFAGEPEPLDAELRQFAI